MERLVKKGWIRRVVNAQDRRSRELSLTAKGNKVRLELLPIVQDLQKEILKPLDSEKQDALIKLIRQVVLSSKTNDAT